MVTLFQTVHGSRLYGLERPDSDHDFYTVTSDKGARRRGRQSITPDGDKVAVPLSAFMLFCEKGVPQALEAMFADPEYSVGEDLLADLRRSYRVGPAVLPTYYRTIKSFAYAGDDKRRRHALRLALCVHQIQQFGRFQPTMSEDDRYWVDHMLTSLRHLNDAHVYRTAIWLSMNGFRE